MLNDDPGGSSLSGICAISLLKNIFIVNNNIVSRYLLLLIVKLRLQAPRVFFRLQRIEPPPSAAIVSPLMAAVNNEQNNASSCMGRGVSMFRLLCKGSAA